MTLPNRASNSGLHIATIAHDGLLWDAYLDFEDDPRQPASYRAKIRFEPPLSQQAGPSAAETTVIIIEESYDDAVAKARSFDNRQLSSLLRSALPDEEEAQGTE